MKTLRALALEELQRKLDFELGGVAAAAKELLGTR
jgi:hypothetical protein